MRSTLRTRLYGAGLLPAPRCSPECLTCDLAAVHPPATPVTVWLLRRIAARRRERPAQRPGWPLSTWWSEALGDE